MTLNLSQKYCFADLMSGVMLWFVKFLIKRTIKNCIKIRSFPKIDFFADLICLISLMVKAKCLDFQTSSEKGSGSRTSVLVSGGCRRPPNGTQFFCFCRRFCQKAPASEVGVPPPEWEILDPQLLVSVLCLDFREIRGL